MGMAAPFEHIQIYPFDFGDLVQPGNVRNIAPKERELFAHRSQSRCLYFTHLLHNNLRAASRCNGTPEHPTLALRVANRTISVGGRSQEHTTSYVLICRYSVPKVSPH